MREADTANSFQLRIAVGNRENKRARNRSKKIIREKRERMWEGERKKEKRGRERNRRGREIERERKSAKASDIVNIITAIR